MQDYEKFQSDWLLKEITPYGRGEKLKSSRPKDGVACYVWRMIKFHAGIDYHTPTTCFFYLANQLRKDEILPTALFACISKKEQEVLDILDARVVELSAKLNLDTTVTARRFQGCLY
jgi:hypothetical protein